MCGICGFYDINGKSDLNSNINSLRLMNNKLSHRGPDAEGYYHKENIFLGHKRLSIIDLDKRSNQPFLSSDKKKILVFNGEIYNFLEIKRELNKKDVNFETTGDTEVLIKSYEQWGFEMLKKIDGMFSFAIIDLDKKIFFCGRDHFGQKPFFYYLKDNLFAFSSELTSLIQHPKISRKANVNNILNYFHYDSFVGDQTPLNFVYKLEPSEYLIFNYDKNSLIKKKYWEIKYGNEKIKEDFSENFFEIFSNSIKKHLISDVPVALYLSGGLDSTSIATVAKRQLQVRNLKAFNLKFGNKSFDEDHYTNLVAKELNLDLETFQISEDNIKTSSFNLIESLDEPLSDPGYLAIGMISKFVKGSNYKVVISGDGGDELFGGYEPFLKYRYFKIINNSRFFLNFFKFIEKINFNESFDYMGLSYKFRVFMRGFKGPNANDLYNARWLSSYLNSEIRQLINYSALGISQIEESDTSQYLTELLNNYKNDLEKLFIQYQRNYLPNLICSHTDKANMRFSIEARSPFLNKELFNYVNSFNRSELLSKLKSKKPLRDFLIKNNMPSIAKAKKKGFTVPMALWINQYLKDEIKTLLSYEFKKLYKFINFDYFENILNDHFTFKKNNYKKIWSLYVLLKWMKKNEILY